MERTNDCKLSSDIHSGMYTCTNTHKFKLLCLDMMMMVHDCLSTWEAEAGLIQIQGPFGLHSLFVASLFQITRAHSHIGHGCLTVRLAKQLGGGRVGAVT